MSEWPPQAHLKIMAADARQLVDEIGDFLINIERDFPGEPAYRKAVLRHWVRKLEASLERL